MSGIFRLKGAVKNYDWGGTDFLPRLLAIENNDQQPFAEYWMGTHPLGMGQAENEKGGSQALNKVAGELPFLFKSLDVKKMLSIQVHPSKEDAAVEFERENAAGIPLDAPNRNYKDANHKPEMAIALSDFWLLHGFKPAEELSYTLLNVVELRELLPVFNESGYAGLYKHVMEMPQADVNRILQPLLDNMSNIYDENGPDKMDEDFWAARAARTFNQHGNVDRGIFSIYLFNLVYLKKGEGIFQPAGLPHAYLEGQNVELMSNSDNVLRGGLTSKHIDVAELLKHVKCEATYPKVLEGEEVAAHIKAFATPVDDFALDMIELGEDDTVTIEAQSPEILLLTEGVVGTSSDEIVLQEGEPSVFIAAGTGYTLTGFSGKATVFRASLPVNKR